MTLWTLAGAKEKRPVYSPMGFSANEQSAERIFYGVN
jgi:hypothetical protein